MDIYCGKCGEPWDSYGITYDKGEGDLTLGEVERFRQGEGCPACDFGTSCTACHGTGKSEEGPYCATCWSYRYVIIRRLVNPHPISSPKGEETWKMGSRPNQRVVESPIIVKHYRKLMTADGPAEEAKALCPDCAWDIPVCEVCGGDGKFKGQGNPLRGLESLLEASDEEPFSLIDQYHI